MEVGSMLRADVRRADLANDLTLEYTERGTGPAVVLLHGYTDSCYAFDEVLDRLPSTVPALAPTQRGHGDSSHPAAGYHIEDFAADVVAFMDAAGVSRAAVVGHSMGSLVAQAVALAHPERVSHLVLIGAATTFDNPVVRELDAAVRNLHDPVPRDFVTEFQASTVYRPIPDEILARVVSESMKLPARVWREALAGVLAYRSGARLAHLTMPTLVVWGDRDEIAPRVEQNRVQEGIATSTLTVYQDAGHSPHWEQPQRFVDDLVSFVAGVV
jgi:non-heme chloroperoxidase